MHKIFSKNNLIFFVFVAFIFVVIVLQFFVCVKMQLKVNLSQLEPISWLHLLELMIMERFIYPNIIAASVQHCLLLF